MSMREIYDKNSDVVKEREKETHQEFVNDLMDLAEATGLNTSTLTLLVGGGPALTNRTKNSNMNITLNTMTRYAAAVGKKIKIDFVDADE